MWLLIVVAPSAETGESPHTSMEFKVEESHKPLGGARCSTSDEPFFAQIAERVLLWLNRPETVVVGSGPAATHLTDPRFSRPAFPEFAAPLGP